MNDISSILTGEIVIVAILALLPYIAIIGIWITTSKIKKSIEEMKHIIIMQTKLIEERTRKKSETKEENTRIQTIIIPAKPKSSTEE